MQHMMRDEGYTNLEVESALDKSKARALQLLRRSVTRMSSSKGYVFDRWRQFVKVRKLIRYLLRTMENQLSPIKVDL